MHYVDSKQKRKPAWKESGKTEVLSQMSVLILLSQPYSVVLSVILVTLLDT